ncbi:OmpH family outer membrane protein [Pseudomonadota bacterium]
MSFKSFFAPAFVAYAVLVGAVPAIAQSTDAANAAAQPGVSPVVLDWDGVLANSKAMKSVQEQFLKHQAALQTKVDEEGKALKKAEEELQRKRTLLAPEQFAAETKKYQERFVAMQRMVQESNGKLNQVRVQATAKVQEVLREEVLKLVKANGISIVFNLRQTLYVDPRMDISQIVLDNLDQALPTVQVTDPTTLK